MKPSRRQGYVQSDCGSAVGMALQNWYEGLTTREQEFIDLQAQQILAAVKGQNSRLIMSLDGARDVVLRMALMQSAHGDLRNMVEV